MLTLSSSSDTEQLVDDFHLEHGLRLHIEPEHKEWAIYEIDAHGQQIGHDQIPWSWTLYFTATSCVLRDNISIKPNYQKDETPAPIEVEQSHVINVILKPGHPRDEGNYSMFGTGRAIKTFLLDICPISARSQHYRRLGAEYHDPAEQESCSAWGVVSYTSEDDECRKETTEDCIGFLLFVKPETFARYAAKVSSGEIDEIVLSVARVDGFYSEWSPSISTPKVKVLLTSDLGHIVTPPPGMEFDPPRLGKVGEAGLYINRRLEFGKRAPEPETVEEMADFGTKQAVPETPAPAAVDPRMLQMLGSLRRAAWFVVCLLALGPRLIRATR